MEIRRAIESEAVLLSSLAMSAKAHWGYSKQALDGWRSELTVSAEDIYAKPTFVVIVAEEIADFYSLEPSAEHWKLDNLWVLPKYINRGIGGALLAHALETATKAGATEVTVDADTNAESFYVESGAVRRGEVPAPIPGHPARVRPQLAFTRASALRAFISAPKPRR
jgi:GNAT superfamily N-acetyltransferase